VPAWRAFFVAATTRAALPFPVTGRRLRARSGSLRRAAREERTKRQRAHDKNQNHLEFSEKNWTEKQRK
jgi:hypothetical protein